MNTTVTKVLIDRLDFIEFKQQLLFLKQPNHKATELANLSMYDFLDIRNFVGKFEVELESGIKYTIKNFEYKLFEICPSIKTYPGCANLIAKILMQRSNYDTLFSSNN